jgi:hypothetical protein
MPTVASQMFSLCSVVHGAWSELTNFRSPRWSPSQSASCSSLVRKRVHLRQQAVFTCVFGEMLDLNLSGHLSARALLVALEFPHPPLGTHVDKMCGTASLVGEQHHPVDGVHLEEVRPDLVPSVDAVTLLARFAHFVFDLEGGFDVLGMDKHARTVLVVDRRDFLHQLVDDAVVDADQRLDDLLAAVREKELERGNSHLLDKGRDLPDLVHREYGDVKREVTEEVLFHCRSEFPVVALQFTGRADEKVDNARDPAGRRGAAAVAGGRVVLPVGPLDVDVGVDDARHDEFAASVDALVGINAERPPDRRDPAVLDGDIGVHSSVYSYDFSTMDECLYHHPFRVLPPPPPPKHTGCDRSTPTRPLRRRFRWSSVRSRPISGQRLRPTGRNASTCRRTRRLSTNGQIWTTESGTATLRRCWSSTCRPASPTPRTRSAET